MMHPLTKEEVERLLDHATHHQARALRAMVDADLDQPRADARAAEALGCSATTIRSHVMRARRRAAALGCAPPAVDAPVPDGFVLDRVSTLRDAEGKLRAQWTIARRFAERDEDMLEAIREALGDARSPRTILPTDAFDVPGADDLLCVYPMGDPHLGMYSWARESGEDFDLAIAERNLYAAADMLVGLARPLRARRALVVNLGDFFHSDSTANRTMRSGNPLDVDTRWGKVLEVGVNVMRRIIDRALEVHDRVDVVNAIGNHDDHTAVMLSLALALFYEREPRVHVDVDESGERDADRAFRYRRFGRNLIGVTHGDKTKLRGHDLPEIMAADVPELWGVTTHRAWLCGHVHHDRRTEHRACTVETFRTLAARDAWHAAAGYRSQRDMKMIVLHREHGEIARHTVGISRLVSKGGS